MIDNELMMFFGSDCTNMTFSSITEQSVHAAMYDILRCLLWTVRVYSEYSVPLKTFDCGTPVATLYAVTRSLSTTLIFYQKSGSMLHIEKNGKKRNDRTEMIE